VEESVGFSSAQYQMSGRPPDTIQVPRLEPKDLYEKRIRRDHARLRAYNTLLEQIYHRVYAASQVNGNTSSLFYTVPPFLLGLPKLDMEDCIVYLVWQLRDAKFEVRFTWPNLLFISWRHHEGEYLTKKNPIVQAMTPEPAHPPAAPPPAKRAPRAAPAARPPARQNTGVSFADEIALLTGGSSAAPLPRRAAEYQPPASFIQTLDAPTPRRAASPSVQGGVLSDLWAVR
jgi:hypothetical protein